MTINMTECTSIDTHKINRKIKSFLFCFSKCRELGDIREKALIEKMYKIARDLISNVQDVYTKKTL